LVEQNMVTEYTIFSIVYQMNRVFYSLKASLWSTKNLAL